LRLKISKKKDAVIEPDWASLIQKGVPLLSFPFMVESKLTEVQLPYQTINDVTKNR